MYFLNFNQKSAMFVERLHDSDLNKQLILIWGYFGVSMSERSLRDELSPGVQLRGDRLRLCEWRVSVPAWLYWRPLHER